MGWSEWKNMGDVEVLDTYEITLASVVGGTSTISINVVYNGETYSSSVSGTQTTGTKSLTVGGTTFVLRAWYYGTAFNIEGGSTAMPNDTHDNLDGSYNATLLKMSNGTLVLVCEFMT